MLGEVNGGKEIDTHLCRGARTKHLAAIADRAKSFVVGPGFDLESVLGFLRRSQSAVDLLGNGECSLIEDCSKNGNL